jgi:predicted nucleotidyltransferase
MVAPALTEKRDQILRIASQYGASNVRVFGSMARGDYRNDSDIDLLVDFEPKRSLMDHAGLVIELEALLGRSVEIGTPKGLRTDYKERILNEAVPL